METKLCRICGKLGQSYVYLFRTEGLKNKVETCLPIVVSPHSLLPDTICGECYEHIDSFYSFIKNCLQNIIILEAQYDITESCLKTKRKQEKGCLADIAMLKHNKSIQTDDYLDVLLQQVNENDINNGLEPLLCDNQKLSDLKRKLLVDYDVESDSSEIEDNSYNNTGKVIINSNNVLNNRIDDLVSIFLTPKNNLALSKQYFDDAENNLIDEIAQRKSLKRKSKLCIESSKPKIFKLDTSNRRKCKQPKKVESKQIAVEHEVDNTLDFVALEKMYEQLDNRIEDVNPADSERRIVDEKPPELEKKVDPSTLLPQTCLLCSNQFLGPSAMAAHVFEMHGIDMAQILSSLEAQNDKKKKLPNLVKISDLKHSDSFEDNQDAEATQSEDSPALAAPHMCTLCPAVFTSSPDLYTHLRLKHPEQASLTCGLCLSQASSYITLKSHLDICTQEHPVTTRYFCQICKYGEDSSKMLEHHVLVHSFLLEACKKQNKIFDPDDYIETNDLYDVSCGSPNFKSLSCSDCGLNDFDSFKDFSAHRRSKHSIFHCDLCNKFYGRNSHLWKHVNRLHKGHPSITCQLCYKTSASKYHLSQHFNKIHSTKPCKTKHNELQLGNDNSEDFMSQKFQAFDFQSVKQSFMRQELLEQGKKALSEEPDDNSNQLSGDESPEEKTAVSMPTFVEPPYAPKEIDASSDLYTNIITNYTPPVNEGEFKCPKCGKGFHKKSLLKKHKKNCRPRLQKDLLTRCKSCQRVFKDRQSLAKHLVNYHSEYACEICGQKVQSKCEIVAHIRFTHPTCHLICNICGNILRSRADLNDHKKDHVNSYICQFCADSLPSKIKLKMHILSLHRKILSLSCGICLKLFETQHVLRDHVRLVHKDQLTPLTSCPVCGKNYGSKWKTYDHLNKSHGRIFKACKTCLEVFNTDNELQTHYEVMHGGQNVNIKSTPSALSNSIKCTVKESQNNNKSYQSESEQEDEDNSEQSNDVDNYNSNPEKQSDVEDQRSNEYVNFPELSAAKSKISLLEKRLLGKKLTEEDTKYANADQNKITISSSDTTNNKHTISNNKNPESKKQENKIIKANNTNTNIQNIKQELEECNEAAINNSSNPQHNSSKRTVYVNSNDPSLCEICFKTWPAKKHLWQHYIRCHKSVAATVCGICLKTNPDYATLQKHLVETHPNLLHGQGFGSNFICRICGRYHNASSKLKLHMAIHEKYEWSFLEENMIKPEVKTEEPNESSDYQYIFKKDDQAENDNFSINYESMIEQVECSESDNEESNMADPQNQSSSEIEEQDDEEDEDEQEDGEEDESDNESCISEPSLERRMLNNMLREKQHLLIKNASETNQNSESSDSDDSSNSSSDDVSRDSSSSQNKSDSSVEATENTGSNMFMCKPDELDSAIKSISYVNNVNEIDDDIDDDFCEMQQQNLNENELESAVGSIL